MKTETNQEYMTDAQGRLVPISTVRPQDKLEHDFVSELMDQAQSLSKSIAFFRATVFAETDAFIDLLAEKYGLKKGGSKGNVTFSSYDGLLQIKISNNDFLVFGAELQIAKELIDECIKSWGTDQNPHIVALVNHAFRVDNQGKVNKGDILGLRRIKIEDKTWQKAMEAINDSIRVSRTKRYVRFYKRANINEPFTAVSLDIAQV